MMGVHAWGENYQEKQDHFYQKSQGSYFQKGEANNWKKCALRIYGAGYIFS